MTPNYTPVRYLGQRGWKIPVPWRVLPSNGAARVVGIDPDGQSHLVKKGSLSRS